jgi:hypothetical protein
LPGGMSRGTSSRRVISIGPVPSAEDRATERQSTVSGVIERSGCALLV